MSTESYLDIESGNSRKGHIYIYYLINDVNANTWGTAY
jgi:hypothetical protein